MSRNKGLHDRIRAGLRAAPGGLTSREIVVAVRGEYLGVDTAISCALRRLHVVANDITLVRDAGGRTRYYLKGTEPANTDIMRLLTLRWAATPAGLPGDDE